MLLSATKRLKLLLLLSLELSLFIFLHNVRIMFYALFIRIYFYLLHIYDEGVQEIVHRNKRSIKLLLRICQAIPSRIMDAPSFLEFFRSDGR